MFVFVLLGFLTVWVAPPPAIGFYREVSFLTLLLLLIGTDLAFAQYAQEVGFVFSSNRTVRPRLPLCHVPAPNASRSFPSNFAETFSLLSSNHLT